MIFLFDFISAKLVVNIPLLALTKFMNAMNIAAFFKLILAENIVVV